MNEKDSWINEHRGTEHNKTKQSKTNQPLQKQNDGKADNWKKKTNHTTE